MSAQVLSVSLPSEIIYVSGTVNGTAYTWTLIEGAWTATVERAADDTYAVALTAVTAAGVSTNYALTLYYGLLSLITDRTRADQPTQEGTPLNKASLLKDATAKKFGLDPDALPDDVLVAIASLTKKHIKNLKCGEILTSTNWKAPNNILDNSISGLIVGGGGSGGTGGHRGGGGSGHIMPFSAVIVPGETYQLVIGAGGLSVASGSNSQGNDGGTTTAFGFSAAGGQGGGAVGISGGNGGAGGAGGPSGSSNGGGFFCDGEDASTYAGRGGGLVSGAEGGGGGGVIG